MFDVGFWELVVIFGLGLLILGPEKLPRVANKIGRWVGKARRTASDLRRQLERELDFDELSGKKSYSTPRPPPPPSSTAAAAPPISDHAPPEDDEPEPLAAALDSDPLASPPEDNTSSISAADDPAPDPVATSTSK